MRNCMRRIKKLLELAADPTVELWALDEVHFCQHGSRCRMWVPPEDKDPICLHHPTRKSIGYFGAVRLSDGKLIAKLEDGKFNGQTFWAFLQHLHQITATGSIGKRVVLISDNAKYHHAVLHKEWRAQQEPQFSLDFLPPYSPDLNPIERVWKLLRRLRMHNQYFPELNLVLESVEAQFEQWKQPNEILRRLVSLC
jgi:transposase